MRYRGKGDVRMYAFTGNKLKICCMIIHIKDKQLTKVVQSLNVTGVQVRIKHMQFEILRRPSMIKTIN